MGEQDDTMPRAKRLKLLKEAKERKERAERGEIVDDEPVASESLSKSAEKDSDDENDSSELVDATDAHLHVSKTEELEHEGVAHQEEEEEDVLNLAPKRANWDIERDIAPMLKKLERRTQHAIVEILREKMAAEQQDEDGEDDDDEEEEEEQDEEQVEE